MDSGVLEEPFDRFLQGIMAFAPCLAEQGFRHPLARKPPGLEADKDNGLPISPDDNRGFML